MLSQLRTSFILILILFFLSTFHVGCKKFIEIPAPSSSITEANVFDNDLTAISVVTGIYSNMGSRDMTSLDVMKISKLAGLSADELNLWSGATNVEQAYYRNDLFSNSSSGTFQNAGIEVWNSFYEYIYDCNQAIEGLSNSSKLSLNVKRQLIGEALFLRSFFYLYLVNFYGDVPLVVSTDPNLNRLKARTPQSLVYQQIISDLNEAQDLLSPVFLDGSLRPYSTGEPQRTRPTKWAARALLARTLLFAGLYAEAETEATAVIEQTQFFDLPGVALDQVFLKNSKEAIWQIQPTNAGWNTLDGDWFSLSSPPAGFSEKKSAFISSHLNSAFEDGDLRREIWVDSFITSEPDGIYLYPAKYKVSIEDPNVISPESMNEFQMVLRLAEVYLIRAECRARSNNLSSAISDINIVRTRARAFATFEVPNPLPDLSPSLTHDELIQGIMHERQVELFTEWGHRWLDLKRTSMITTIMPVITAGKGGSWVASDQYYPLPVEDIQRNPNLIQNPGY